MTFRNQLLLSSLFLAFQKLLVVFPPLGDAHTFETMLVAIV